MSPVSVKVSKEAVEGAKPVPSGIYEFRLDGFKPILAKSGESVNLRPVMKVLVPEGYKDASIFFNGNTSFVTGLIDFFHSLGEDIDIVQDEGEYSINLPFADPIGKKHAPPTEWLYIGACIGRTGKVEVLEVPKRDKNGNQTNDGRSQNEIKRFFCVIAGCQRKHSESLISTKSS